jgi:hypothetical protein
VSTILQFKIIIIIIIIITFRTLQNKKSTAKVLLKERQKFVSPQRFNSTCMMMGPTDIREELEIKYVHTINTKALPLQALTGREDSRRLRLPDFKTLGT